MNGSGKDVILLSHGDGGLLTHELIRTTFFPSFKNEWLDEEGDSAVLNFGHERLAFSTDSFVVSPLFFPGGDIGKLAVCGTVNDLVVSGARPLWLSAAFIIPEGMPVKRLAEIVRSMSEISAGLKVPIVTGDTKVVGGTDPENLFINTTGIGKVCAEAKFNVKKIEPSDTVIITGSIGDHGAAILAARLGLGPEESPQSDCAPLIFLIDLLRPYFPYIKVMRDPTRGGLATSLKELASSGGVDFWLEEKSIVVKPKVKAIADILGIDPYYLASEGRAILIVENGIGEEIIKVLQKHPLGKDAGIIGYAEKGKGNLFLRTRLGGTRPLQMLAGTPLPRIC